MMGPHDTHRRVSRKAASPDPCFSFGPAPLCCSSVLYQRPDLVKRFPLPILLAVRGRTTTVLELRIAKR